ncbi:MAG: cell division protein FtsL [Acidobacteria bacterium]|nr:cell division protein FtsL [Acidobacteriota bacterium]
MSIDLTYAVRKDIRNNPVVREHDLQQKREFRRIVALASLAVGMLLFSAWQHFQTRTHSMRIEALRVERAKEEAVNRKLRLNLEVLRAPDVIELRATRELGLRAPTLAETVVIERARVATPPPAMVARATGMP